IIWASNSESSTISTRKEDFIPLLDGRLGPIMIIDIGKDVVHGFDLGQPPSVDAGRGELLVQGDEAQEVILDASAGVIGTGAGAKDEGPVAGLGEQQFAAGLFEGTFLEAGSSRMAMDQGRHSLLGDVEVRVDPLVRFIEPDFPVALFAPTRGA